MLQRALDTQGYAVVPFLSDTGLGALRSAWRELAPPNGYGSHYTSQVPDVGYRASVLEAIAEVFASGPSDVMAGYRPVVANFFAKEPGPHTSMVVHQDWTFVDERRHRSINVWVPLVDTTERNGTLGVVPGSHRAFDRPRGTAVGSSGLPSPFAGSEAHMARRWVRPLDVTAGHAVVNDHRTVHCSPDNLSEEPRVAASITLLPVGVRARHLYGRGGMVEVYELDDSEFVRLHIGGPPPGTAIGRERVPLDPLTAAEIDGALQKVNSRRTAWTAKSAHPRRGRRRAR